jgi:hypothetical protein
MKTSTILFALGLSLAAVADDLDQALEASAPADEAVSATFKSLRVVQSQSVETTQKGVLNLTISHRFGPMGTGMDGFMGLDFARIRLGLDYGLTDWTDLGLERSNNEGKPVDLFLKQRLLRQTTSGSVPLSLTWYSAGYLMTDMGNAWPYSLPFSDRFSSTHQIIAARKFGERLSVQVAPTLVTRQLRPFDADKEVAAGVEVGGRWKLSSRVALTAEVAPMFYGVSSNWDPALAVGMDIETGGHVFQLNVSNSAWLSEDRLYTQTKGGNDSPVDGGSLALGFNITRGFGVGWGK